MSKAGPSSDVPPPGSLTFSFRYLDASTAKFRIDHCDGHYFRTVLDKLKALSEKNRNDFLSLPATGGKVWRVHRINWTDNRVTESSFGLPVQLTSDENAWQFNVSLNRGRVHGFLIGSTFFVRWMDPQHNLYGGRQD